MKDASKLACICCTLSAVGALNWGLVGLFDYDVVTSLFGHLTPLTRTLYAVIGMSGAYSAYHLLSQCQSCKK